MFAILLFAFLLTGCSEKNATSDTSVTENQSYAETGAVMPEEAGEAAAVPAGAETESDYAVGGSRYCNFHTPSYHEVDEAFIEYVGRDAFDEWTKTLISNDTDDGECKSTGTFPNFLLYFQITKETFCNIYYNNNCYYMDAHDENVLYGGDEDKIVEFYRDINFYNSELLWKNSEFTYKIDLRNLIVTEVSDTVNSEYQNLRKLSIVELIKQSGINREDALKMLEDVNARFGSSLGYDFDKIYSETDKLISIGDAITIDEAVRIS